MFSCRPGPFCASALWQAFVRGQLGPPWCIFDVLWYHGAPNFRISLRPVSDWSTLLGFPSLFVLQGGEERSEGPPPRRHHKHHHRHHHHRRHETESGMVVGGRAFRSLGEGCGPGVWVAGPNHGTISIAPRLDVHGDDIAHSGNETGSRCASHDSSKAVTTTTTTNPALEASPMETVTEDYGGEGAAADMGEGAYPVNMEQAAPMPEFQAGGPAAQASPTWFGYGHGAGIKREP